VLTFQRINGTAAYLWRWFFNINFGVFNMTLDNIDTLNARLTQAQAILNLLTAEGENPALWAVETLLDQAQEAADKLWLQKVTAAA
jgi:uncharacterized protein (DUF608 family)